MATANVAVFLFVRCRWSLPIAEGRDRTTVVIIVVVVVVVIVTLIVLFGLCVHASYFFLLSQYYLLYIKFKCRNSRMKNKS